MANALRLRLYRVEQTGNNTFVKTADWPQDLLTADVKSVTPVNALGGPDLGGLGYLYSKITMKQPGLQQEAYALQTVLELQAAMNA